VNALLAIPETDPRVRDKLDPGIWVEPRDKDCRDEDARQIEVVNQLKRCPQIAFHAVPNGGRQSDWARIRGERMGVVTGQPDLGIDWPGGSAAIEMKDGQDMPRQSQIDRLNRLHRMGKKVAVCRTVEGVFGRLRAWGAPVGEGLL
jgi:hypothetical protein